MKYFEDELGDFRGKVYESFRNIIARMSIANKVEFDTPLAPVSVFVNDDVVSFLCESIEMNKDGYLFFSDGTYVLGEAEFDTDALVYMHDEIVATYELDD